MPINHFISLATAEDMTTLYQQKRETILAPAYQNQNILAIAEKFDRAAIDTILALEGCVALRIYYGMSEDYKVHAILVGVNEYNEDILPTTNSLNLDDPDMIAEMGIRCPEDCASDSPLNG
jgi:hypothetical protein